MLFLIFIGVCAFSFTIAKFSKKNFLVNNNSYVKNKDFFSYLGKYKLSSNNISLDINVLNRDYIFIKARSKDLDLNNFFISGDYFIKAKLIKNRDKSAWDIKLFSNNAYINEAELLPIRAGFIISKDALKVNKVKIGRHYEIDGTVFLTHPFKTDLCFKIKRADIRNFVNFVKIEKPEQVFGILNGVFNLKGDKTELYAGGLIKTKNGRIGPLKYDSLEVEVEGLCPIINIVNADIKQDGGVSYIMEGNIDLRDIGKGNMISGLRIITRDMKTVVWDTWDITKLSGSALRLSKNITDNMQVGFKTSAREPYTTYYDEEGKEEMSIEYKIGSENLKMELRENEEFLGIEHKLKF